VQGRRKSIAAEGSNKSRIDRRISFKPGGDIAPRGILDLAQEVMKRTWR
jgi:hypothetical protein